MKVLLPISLTLLAASVAGSAFAENPYAPTGNEQVIGQTQILYHPTADKVNTLTGEQVGAEGWSIKCMNDAKNLEQAGAITVNGKAYRSIKLSNGAQNTVTLPEGCVANAVTIYSVMNFDATAKTPRTCYWKEIDGTKYDAPAEHHLTSFKDFANPDISYFTLSGDKNTFTFANAGEQTCVVLVVDYTKKEVAPVEPGFGEDTLAVSHVWPGKENAMLPLQGEFVLTFPSDVTVAGKADLNGTALDMVAEGANVKIAYTGLTAATAYTLTIPAKTIGNAEGANEELTYTFTTRPANVLFYSDFNFYPYEYYQKYGLPFITANVNIHPAGTTDKTETIGGMNIYSGTSGRVIAMQGNCNNADPEKDYGPYSDADKGASNRCIQFIGGGKKLYIEFPEIEGPAEVTFYLGNPDTTAKTAILTDELGDTSNKLAEFKLPAAKKMKKFTYSYPYKGTVKLRLYNMNTKLDINDILIVKGEGEGIDKPVIVDEEVPVLVKSWPSEAPYAPVEGTIALEYNENIFVTGKATVNGVETDVVVNGKKATIAYSGLENGKAYTVNIPAVADEAGNATEATTMTLNTIAADVLYYTDYGYFPYEYWTKYNMYPADGADNGDILAKNSKNKEATIADVRYFVGNTAGRVVAMGKSNLVDDPDVVGGTPRCAQISGGGDDLYLELKEVVGPCKLTLIVGNSTAKEFEFYLRNAVDSETANIATFKTTAEKKMFKFEHTFEAATPVKFRIYNHNNQFNLHDIILTKVEGSTGVSEVAAEAEAPAVYYNLQGVRVENPAEGLYIRVRGNKVEKVIL